MEPQAVSYALGMLRNLKVNYVPFLAELADAVFGLEHFSDYLIVH